MPRLVGDDALGDANSSSRGRKTGPQRVTCHLGGIKPGTGSVALQHQRHRLAAQSCFADVAVAVHGTKGCSLGDFRDLKPRAPGTDRAGCRVRPVGDTCLDQATACDQLDRNDWARTAYVRHMYGRDPRDPKLYHLVIDTTVTSVDTCVDTIVAVATGFWDARR